MATVSKLLYRPASDPTFNASSVLANSPLGNMGQIAGAGIDMAANALFGRMYYRPHDVTPYQQFLNIGRYGVQEHLQQQNQANDVDRFKEVLQRQTGGEFSGPISDLILGQAVNMGASQMLPGGRLSNQGLAYISGSVGPGMGMAADRHLASARLGAFNQYFGFAPGASTDQMNRQSGFSANTLAELTAFASEQGFGRNIDLEDRSRRIEETRHDIGTGIADAFILAAGGEETFSQDELKRLRKKSRKMFNEEASIDAISQALTKDMGIKLLDGQSPYAAVKEHLGETDIGKRLGTSIFDATKAEIAQVAELENLGLDKFTEALQGIVVDSELVPTLRAVRESLSGTEDLDPQQMIRMAEHAKTVAQAMGTSIEAIIDTQNSLKDISRNLTGSEISDSRAAQIAQTAVMFSTEGRGRGLSAEQRDIFERQFVASQAIAFGSTSARQITALGQSTDEGDKELYNALAQMSPEQADGVLSALRHGVTDIEVDGHKFNLSDQVREDIEVLANPHNRAGHQIIAQRQNRIENDIVEALAAEEQIKVAELELEAAGNDRNRRLEAQSRLEKAKKNRSRYAANITNTGYATDSTVNTQTMLTHAVGQLEGLGIGAALDDISGVFGEGEELTAQTFFATLLPGENRSALEDPALIKQQASRFGYDISDEQAQKLSDQVVNVVSDIGGSRAQDMFNASAQASAALGAVVSSSTALSELDKVRKPRDAATALNQGTGNFQHLMRMLVNPEEVFGKDTGIMKGLFTNEDGEFGFNRKQFGKLMEDANFSDDRKQQLTQLISSFSQMSDKEFKATSGRMSALGEKMSKIQFLRDSGVGDDDKRIKSLSKEVNELFGSISAETGISKDYDEDTQSFVSGLLEESKGRMSDVMKKAEKATKESNVKVDLSGGRIILVDEATGKEREAVFEIAKTSDSGKSPTGK